MKQKENQNGRLKKTEIFNFANSQYFSGIGAWVSCIFCALIYGVQRMGQNFDDYPDFQQKAKGGEMI